MFVARRGRSELTTTILAPGQVQETRRAHAQVFRPAGGPVDPLRIAAPTCASGPATDLTGDTAADTRSDDVLYGGSPEIERYRLEEAEPCVAQLPQDPVIGARR